MIAQATHTAPQASNTTSTSHTTDPRTRAKARLRAAAAKPKPAPTPAERLKNFDHTTVVDFVKRHPLATAAGVGAAATMIGPIRMVRLGMTAFRTVSLAAGVVTFLGSLGVPEAEKAVEAAMPHGKDCPPRKRTSNTTRRTGTTAKTTTTRKKARRSTKSS